MRLFRLYTISSTILAGLFVVLLGGVFIYDALYDAVDYAQLLKTMPEEFRLRIVIALVGVGGILVGLGVVLLPLSLYMSGAEIAYDTEHGRVRVSSSSVTEFLRQQAAEIGGIHDLSAQVVERKGEVSVEVQASVDVGRPLPELMGELQSHILAELEDTLGLPNVKHVNVRLAKLVATKARRNRKAATPAPAPKPEPAPAAEPEPQPEPEPEPEPEPQPEPHAENVIDAEVVADDIPDETPAPAETATDRETHPAWQEDTGPDTGQTEEAGSSFSFDSQPDEKPDEQDDDSSTGDKPKTDNPWG